MDNGLDVSAGRLLTVLAGSVILPILIGVYARTRWILGVTAILGTGLLAVLSLKFFRFNSPGLRNLLETPVLIFEVSIMAPMLCLWVANRAKKRVVKVSMVIFALIFMLIADGWLFAQLAVGV